MIPKKVFLKDFPAIILCILFILAGSLISLNRYWQYEAFYYDFGIFDQAIWKVSHFSPPIVDHFVIGGKWIFADHFNPSIFIFSPIYWITNRSEAFFILQSLVVGLSGFTLYIIGKKILKNRFLSFAVLLNYFLFVGLENAVISDFHEVTVATFPLALTFLSIIEERKYLYLFFFLITLGFKESNFLLGIGIAAFIFLTKKNWRKLAYLTAAISILFGFLTIKLIIPYFSGGFYQYYPALSNNNIFLSFFDNSIKRNTLFFSFASFSFLPLLSPPFWVLIFQDFFTRFIPEGGFTRWTLGLHYNAQLALILALSSIFSLRYLMKYNRLIKFNFLISLVLVMNSIFLYRFILHAPFALSYNSAFYKHTKDFSFLDKLISQVPKNASVMTQNNLASHFTHQKVWLIRKDYKNYAPDYIIVDLRKDQNLNNFFGERGMSTPYDIFEKLVYPLQKDKDYSLIYKTNEQFIFKKK